MIALNMELLRRRGPKGPYPPQVLLSSGSVTPSLRRRTRAPCAEGTICNNCLRRPCDAYADHAVSCMHGPNRYHNAIRNTMARISQDAVLAPVIEPSSCNESEKRPDVLLSRGSTRHTGGAATQ
jgi:hypothetical protein